MTNRYINKKEALEALNKVIRSLEADTRYNTGVYVDNENITALMHFSDLSMSFVVKQDISKEVTIAVTIYDGDSRKSYITREMKVLRPDVVTLAEVLMKITPFIDHLVVGAAHYVGENAAIDFVEEEYSSLNEMRVSLLEIMPRLWMGFYLGTDYVSAAIVNN